MLLSRAIYNQCIHAILMHEAVVPYSAAVQHVDLLNLHIKTSCTYYLTSLVSAHPRCCSNPGLSSLSTTVTSRPTPMRRPWWWNSDRRSSSRSTWPRQSERERYRFRNIITRMENCHNSTSMVLHSPHHMLLHNTQHWVAQWSKALHLSARGVTTDTLVRFQAISQPAMIGSPIGRRTIDPASSRFGWCSPSLYIIICS